METGAPVISACLSLPFTDASPVSPFGLGARRGAVFAAWAGTELVVPTTDESLAIDWCQLFSPCNWGKKLSFHLSRWKGIWR